MAYPVAENVPYRSKWCQICGKYTASPVDVVELRRLLELNGTPKPDAPGQAHFGCLTALREGVSGAV